tara:strand:- start:15143 stop:15316 length:174 start_codon:yes stop_codon:yes gene_type:complete
MTEKQILASIVSKVDPSKLSVLELDRAFYLVLEVLGTCQAFHDINAERFRHFKNKNY